jgi:hypothetical protein
MHAATWSCTPATHLDVAAQISQIPHRVCIEVCGGGQPHRLAAPPHIVVEDDAADLPPLAHTRTITCGPQEAEETQRSRPVGQEGCA